MARKLTGFERVLDGKALFAVAYGEIGSSIYFALGIVVAAALGLTPLVLLGTGLLFLVVALSYAEGVTAIPETGGAETFTRRAFNDLAGFVTGWALFLDYVIVIALAALFVPHYVGVALSAPSLRESPWDAVAGCFVIAAVAIARLVRHQRLHRGLLAFALLDLAVQALVVALGLAFLFSPETLTDGFELAPGQSWHDVLFAIPLGMLAYTGLETVANYAQEVRDPGRTLPRAMFAGIGLVVGLTVLIAAIGVSAYPATTGESGLHEEWLEAPIVGIVVALEGDVPEWLDDALQVAVGLSAAAILLGALTTGISGATRLAHSMGEHGMLPREFGRLERRTLVSQEAILAITVLSIVVVVGTAVADYDVEFLASVFSFGVLLAFSLAQLAVIRLRVREPQLERPFRAGPDVRMRGVALPLAALVGFPLTVAVLVLALVTHPGARYAGPVWVALGLCVYAITRRRAQRGILEDVDPLAEIPAESAFRRVLVPVKLGDVGEEVAATAVALAKERGAHVDAITVVRVPRRYPLEGSLPADVARRADEALEEARLLGEENAVDVTTSIVAARAIGPAIVEEASRRGSELIVLGSAPRWRRQSRFFSPTVDYVLEHAPCEVLVVAFPDGVFE